MSTFLSVKTYRAIAFALACLGSASSFAQLQLASDPLPAGFSPIEPRHAQWSGNGAEVVFDDTSPFLAGLDCGLVPDVFVYNVATGGHELITYQSSANGRVAKGGYQPFISANGRYVVFTSLFGYAASDTDGRTDIYRYDRQTLTFTKASVTIDGQNQALSLIGPSSVSDDGRFVAFYSSASNFVLGDTNNNGDIFLRDLVNNTTTCVSANSSGNPTGTLSNFSPHISADGRYVAYANPAGDLIAYDRITGNRKRLNETTTGTRISVIQPAGLPMFAGMSDNYLCIFYSGTYDPNNLANMNLEIYASNIVGSGAVKLYPNAAGQRINRAPATPSRNGRFISVNTVTPGGSFLRNLDTGATLPVGPVTLNAIWNSDASRGVDEVLGIVYNTAGAFLTDIGISVPGQSVGASGKPALSGDGSVVVFDSDSNNLWGSIVGPTGLFYDLNCAKDAALRNLNTGVTKALGLGGGNHFDQFGTEDPAISEGGEFVSFTTYDRRLRGSDRTYPTVVVRGVTSNEAIFKDCAVRRDFPNKPNLFANAASWNSDLSNDGRYVTFQSLADNFGPTDGNGVSDVYVIDTLTYEWTLVSRTATGVAGNGASESPSISNDGRYIVFESSASNLVPNDTNGKRDIFLFDRSTNEVTRVSVRPSGAESNGIAGRARISGDGQVIVYDTDDDLMVAGDSNGFRDVLRQSRSNGLRSRVSQAPSTAANQPNGNSYSGTPNTNGLMISFTSEAGIVSGDGNNLADTYVKHVETNQVYRVTNRANNVAGEYHEPTISANGARIATVAVGVDSDPRACTFANDVYVAATPFFTSNQVISGVVNFGNYIGAIPATVEVRIVGQFGNITTVSAPLDANRRFTVTMPYWGTYSVGVKGSHWLRREIDNVALAGSSVTNLTFNLINGDCDGSNSVDLSDYLILGASFDLSTGNGGFNPQADLDGSGTVDLSDYLILVANFDQNGD